MKIKLKRRCLKILIRSQDRFKLIPLADGYVAVFGRGVFLVPHSDARSIELGLYSNEENAIKVLDAIQITYNNYEKAKIMLSSTFLESTFQMPQDDEV